MTTFNPALEFGSTAPLSTQHLISPYRLSSQPIEEITITGVSRDPKDWIVPTLEVEQQFDITLPWYPALGKPYFRYVNEGCHRYDSSSCKHQVCYIDSHGNLWYSFLDGMTIYNLLFNNPDRPPTEFELEHFAPYRSTNSDMNKI